MAQKVVRTPIESKLILQNLDVETLQALAALSSLQQYPFLVDFCKRFSQTKRNEILDQDTYDERRLATNIARRQGMVYALGILVEVVSGAKAELNRRETK